MYYEIVLEIININCICTVLIDKILQESENNITIMSFLSMNSSSSTELIHIRNSGSFEISSFHCYLKLSQLLEYYPISVTWSIFKMTEISCMNCTVPPPALLSVPYV